MKTLNWEKEKNGLLPVIIQDVTSKNVLMLGYMNKEAFEKTKTENRVTFYSRSKQRLWTKGESSQNFLDVVSIQIDCDQDTILIKVNAHGPACHTGTTSCFNNDFYKDVNKTTFTIKDLEKVIHQRIDNKVEDSYTYSLIKKGINKVAQKVGEEAVETVIEAMDSNDELFLYESADLMYHYLILLKSKGFSLIDIEKELSKRR